VNVPGNGPGSPQERRNGRPPGMGRYAYPCALCEAEAVAGGVSKLWTAEGLRKHRFEAHGEAT
jgi:hypothetical protein